MVIARGEGEVEECKGEINGDGSAGKYTMQYKNEVLLNCVSV